MFCREHIRKVLKNQRFSRDFGKIVDKKSTSNYNTTKDCETTRRDPDERRTFDDKYTQIRAYIESQGLKLGHVARVLGISSSALHQKLNDESDFKVSEADRLSAMLGLTMEQRDACFFGPGTRMCQRKGAA